MATMNGRFGREPEAAGVPISSSLLRKETIPRPLSGSDGKRTDSRPGAFPSLDRLWYYTGECYQKLPSPATAIPLCISRESTRGEKEKTSRQEKEAKTPGPAAAFRGRTSPGRRFIEPPAVG